MVFAGSLGALGALGWASRNRSRVLAVAATLPIVDLADVHDHDRGGFASEIETAYGGRQGYDDQVAGHNPAALVATLAGLRFKAWYSTDDPIASAPALEAFVDALGPPAAARSLGPIGHSAGKADPEEIVERFSTESGRLAVGLIARALRRVKSFSRRGPSVPARTRTS